MSEIEVLGINDKIYNIRNLQVMIDSDLAYLYGVELKRLNEQVKRNIERFPENFRFQLRENEYENLRSQFATSSFEHGGRRYLPYAFTEQDVSMLSAVLKSKTAVKTSIKIINSFVNMRKFISTNASLFQLKYQMQTDEKWFAFSKMDIKSLDLLGKLP